MSEGELHRFKPGMEFNFIPRWLQLSTRSLRYYKNQIHAVTFLTRPIVSIPLQAIHSVRPYQLKNPDYKKRQRALYDHMFELTLRQDYEDLYFFRELEVNGARRQSVAGGEGK